MRIFGIHLWTYRLSFATQRISSSEEWILFAAAAVIVWIVNSHKPYGMAEEKNFTFSHMDKYYYCKA